MKKLMILAAAVVATVAANAAAITWGSGTVYLADGTTKAGKDVVTGYLFLIDATTYNTLAANTTGTALSDAVYAAYGSSLATADAKRQPPLKALLTSPTQRHIQTEIRHMPPSSMSTAIITWVMLRHTR